MATESLTTQDMLMNLVYITARDADESRKYDYMWAFVESRAASLYLYWGSC